MSTWTLQGLTDTNLGQVHSERLTRDANLMLMPMPTLRADEAFAFDFNGAQETIDITGEKQFATTADAQGWVGTTYNPAIGTLRGLISGMQFDPIVYTSDFYGSVLVKVASLDVDFDNGAPYPRVNYRISLIVTSV